MLYLWADGHASDSSYTLLRLCSDGFRVPRGPVCALPGAGGNVAGTVPAWCWSIGAPVGAGSAVSQLRQSFTMRSLPPDATMEPSGLQSTAYTSSACPGKSILSFLLRTSQTCAPGPALLPPCNHC